LKDAIVYKADYQIRTSEIDPAKLLKPSSMIQLMQDASMLNAIDLKVSVWDLEKNNLSWILLKKHLSIVTTPALGETITINTYPAGYNRLLAYRDYIVSNEQSEVIAMATSTWGLINLHSKKMIKIPAFPFYNHVPEQVLSSPAVRLHKLKSVDRSIEKHISWNDLDWNSHVNNISTIRLLLDSAPRQESGYRNLTELSVQFKHESFINDHLISECKIEGSNIHHQVRRQSDDKLIALGNSLWK